MTIKDIHVRILMMLALTPIFCRAQVSEDQKALDSFKSLVRRHIDSYELNPREHVTNFDSGWAKECFTIDPSSANFDVEKTSSLVSPYVGTLTFKLIRKLSAFHSTEAEADADTCTRESANLHKDAFAYQDHQWQPTSRQHTALSGSLEGIYFPCDEFLLKREKPSEKDIHGCLEEFDGDK